MKIHIIGRGQVLYETAERLAEEHRITHILTAPVTPEYSRDEKDFELLAKRLNVPFHFSRKMDTRTREFMKATSADIAVSINWISILQRDEIELFPHGILNAHAGDLPGYKGNAVINWALLRLEPRITFTIHKMTPGEVDTGDILLQHHMEISPRTTVKDIMKYGEQKTPDMFAEALRKIDLGTVEPLPKVIERKIAFRCYPRLPVYNKIDWTQSALEIDALIRASTHPYSGAYTYIKSKGNLKKIYIWESRVESDETNDVGVPGHIIKNDTQTGETQVYTGKGIIALKTVSYEGEKEFKPGKSWKSIRRRFGVDVEEELIKLYNMLRERELK